MHRTSGPDGLAQPIRVRGRMKWIFRIVIAPEMMSYAARARETGEEYIPTLLLHEPAEKRAVLANSLQNPVAQNGMLTGMIINLVAITDWMRSEAFVNFSDQLRRVGFSRCHGCMRAPVGHLKTIRQLDHWKLGISTMPMRFPAPLKI